MLITMVIYRPKPRARFQGVRRFQGLSESDGAMVRVPASPWHPSLLPGATSEVGASALPIKRGTF